MSDKKQFKTESKRLLDLMINSIYSHKEIFLRELISNASDASDKLYYKALQENIQGISREDMAIYLKADKEQRTLTIEDYGIGMSKDELDSLLGTIAHSGSDEFKKALEKGVDSLRNMVKKRLMSGSVIQVMVMRLMKQAQIIMGQ